jgi:hypothetical protein
MEINKNIKDSWDWQVTIVFYTALHLIDGHVAKTANQHYRSHEEVKQAINPNNNTSPASLDEETFKSYIKLFNLSRRARYLINENHSNPATQANFTYEKHFAKALRHLDKIMFKFNSLYSTKYPSIEISCSYLKEKELNYFKVV